MKQLGRLSSEDFRAAKKLPVVILLENIRSGLNVGSIFRSADAFRAARIICCGFTPSPPHREILKTALGATESVEWAYSENILLSIEELRQNGFSIVAAEQTSASIPLHLFEWNNRQVAVIFGNEVTGVSETTISRCDQTVEISQYGTKHSLNVAVSAGIVLFELSRRYNL
ncbi:MAG: RNA methyltransferase [Crocinitomicaceae bacterium]|nr:RNA methyltransferase [Crocinitomicaceae bacterium]